ncbi:uncharacterized protein FOMMEDRAFT_91011, partial [Fomitiporia mediterranea MF3/22]|uniref:uncharacterized protein n=1 Tax=Fomitiporia mediterranea (strain MF3/22) TaxID=694068 RepID=UPI000440818D
DLSKTISYQRHSLFVEERKYWGELAKQRKKEHEEIDEYPWYVYRLLWFAKVVIVLFLL